MSALPHGSRAASGCTLPSPNVAARARRALRIFRTARGRNVLAVAFVATALLLVTSGAPLRPWVGHSLSAALALLGAAAALGVYAARSRRRNAPAGSAAASARVESRAGPGMHRRIRVALYTVLLAVGVHSTLHAWLAESAEHARAEDARIADLAAAQRMQSQRIGRLASALFEKEADVESGLRALDAALLGAESDALRLESRLRASGALVQPDSPQLNAAWAAWQAARSKLADAAQAVVRHSARVDPYLRTKLVASVQRHADPALEAAQRLVDAWSHFTRERQLAAVSQARVALLLTLLVLAGLAAFVAEPVVRSVKRQQVRLVAQMDELQRLALVAERTTNIVLITDARQRIVWVNDAFRRLTGYERAQAIGRTPASLLVDGRSDARTLVRVRAALVRGDGVRAQLLNRTREGRDLWLDVDIQPLRDASGKLSGFVDVAADITERRRVQADLRIAAIAFDSLEAIAITDARQVILRVNPAFTRITGYEPHEAIGETPGRLLRSGRQHRDFYARMHAALLRDRHWQGELWNRRKNGDLYLEWLSVTAVTDEDGRVENYVAVFSDITQKRKADETIHHLAYYDPLTELPNRRLLRERLQQAMHSSSHTGRYAAVLFIDLDRFKSLNDTRGHDVGDLLLVEVARRLGTGVRASDTVARQGGDEFVIIVRDLSDEEALARSQVQTIAEGIRASLNQPYRLAGQEHHSTPSIGIHLFVGHEQGLDELLKHADVAMYQAKRSGRNTLRFFDPHTHARMTERVALEADLRRALPEHQFRLHFQPQVDDADRVVGAEVLLRWLHPERGLIPPGAFIEVAEESDLIVEIGAWVLECACARLAAWADAPGLDDLRLAVNVSPKQFRQPGFVDQVRNAVSAAGIDPARLKLELTESVVVLDLDEAVETMRRIRALGVGFSMDDFGTGYSSLAYLTRLPLDQLKIDQSFVRNVTANRSDAVIVQTIIGMAANLSIDVIAEGVETVEQRAFLEAHGCRRFQGHLYGKPVPIGEFERTVRDSLLSRSLV